MMAGADIVDRISTTTTTWDLRRDGIPDLRAASLTRKMMTIYKIGAKREAKCDIYDKLSATVNITPDLIMRRVIEHLEGRGGGDTGSCARLDGVETAGRSNNKDNDNDEGFNNGGRETEWWWQWR